MSLLKSLASAVIKKEQKYWEYIYILVDIHDTIFKACYQDEEKFEWFPYAKETLQEMSKCSWIKLILWTSSWPWNIEEYNKVLSENDIHIDYFNENPEVSNTDLACFSSKLYFNVGIDDKFGFDPEKDWYKLYKYFTL